MDLDDSGGGVSAAAAAKDAVATADSVAADVCGACVRRRLGLSACARGGCVIGGGGRVEELFEGALNIYIYISCVNMYGCIYLYIYIYTYIYIYYVYIYIYIHIYIYTGVHWVVQYDLPQVGSISIYVSIYLCIHRYTYLSIYLYICLSTYIYLYIYLCKRMRMYIYLFYIYIFIIQINK